ncbi:hypothetical protein C2E23DRAFT_699855, partial [Lenzites betulinus]
ASSFRMIFLPTPIGGFPTIHRSEPRALTRNLHPQQLRDWEGRQSSTTVGVQVYGLGYPSSEAATAITAAIKASFVEITGCPTVEVAAPIAARDESGDTIFPLPTTYLAYNLTEKVATKLKKHTCWSTEALSFFAYDLLPVIPDLLFTLRGFTSQDPATLKDIVRRTMFSPKYRLFTASFAVDNPRFRDCPPEVIADVLAQSLKVQVARRSRSGEWIVNVYCASPTTSPDLWCIWRNVLGAAEYAHSFVRVGSRVANIVCSGCHGADHSVDDCPFEKLLGWNGEHAL